MSSLSFVIPGEPVAKGRARHGRNRKTGAPVTFTPEKTERFEARARHEAWLAMQAGKRSVLQGAVTVEVDAYWPGPKSWKAVMSLPKPTRPDGDNVAKSVCDAMNTIVFRDDGQVVELVVRKWWAPAGSPARTEISVRSNDGEWP